MTSEYIKLTLNSSIVLVPQMSTAVDCFIGGQDFWIGIFVQDNDTQVLELQYLQKCKLKIIISNANGVLKIYFIFIYD